MTEQEPAASKESISNITAAIFGEGGVPSPVQDEPNGDAPEMADDIPASDPPAADAPPAENQNPAAPDYSWANEFVPEHGNDVEKIKTGFKSKFDSLNSELETLRKAPKTAFANDTIRDLNAFTLATGISDVSLFSKVSTLSIEDKTLPNLIEIIKTADSVSGEDASSAAIREKILRREYKDAFLTDEQIEDLHTDDEKSEAIENRELAQYNLSTKAKDAYKKIEEVRGKIAENQPKEIDVKVQLEQQAKTKELHQNIVNKLVADLKIDIPDSKTENGQTTFTDQVLQTLTFEQSEKDEYQSYLSGYLSNIGDAPITESVMKGADDVAKSLLVWNHLPKIIKKAFDDGRNAAIADNVARNDNPSAHANKQERIPTGGGAKFDAKAFVDAL